MDYLSCLKTRKFVTNKDLYYSFQVFLSCQIICKMTWIHIVTALATFLSLINAQSSTQTTTTAKPATPQKQAREYGFDSQSASLIDMANRYSKSDSWIISYIIFSETTIFVVIS